MNTSWIQVIHDVKHWIANTITGGVLIAAEDDAKRAAQGLVWLNGRLAEEQETALYFRKIHKQEELKNLDLKRRIANLQVERDKAIGEVRYEMESHKCPEPTAEAVIENILRRPLAWVDMKKMDTNTRRTWGGHALSLLNNPLFQALSGTVGLNGDKDTSGELAKDIIEHIAKQSRDHAETRDLRMTLNGIELLRERAKNWLYLDTESTNNEPNAPM